MLDLEKAIPKYLKILKGERKPQFKSVDLNSKIEEAFRMLEDCNLCEWKCGVDRTDGKVGFCGVKDKMLVSANYADKDNDLDFIDPNYSVFFMGCVLKCAFCHNWETSQVLEPKVSIIEKRLAKVIDSKKIPKILDFVGGDPIPHIPFVLKILSHLKKDIPIMWNSTIYMTPESLELINGVIDLHSPDFKYGNDKCAKRLSKIKNYTSVVKRNLVAISEESEVLVRHLVMPNHIECCTKPVLEHIAEAHGNSVLVNIMDHYTPYWKAKKMPDMNRKPRKSKINEALSYAESLGLNYTGL